MRLEEHDAPDNCALDGASARPTRRTFGGYHRRTGGQRASLVLFGVVMLFAAIAGPLLVLRILQLMSGEGL